MIDLHAAFGTRVAIHLVFLGALLPIVDPAPGGGLGLFAITLAAFCAVAGYGIWGPDRGAGNGEGAAMIDLHAAFGTRIAIHLVFLGALLWLGIATSEPVLLVVSLGLLALEWPLARLAHARSAAGTRMAQGDEITQPNVATETAVHRRS